MTEFHSEAFGEDAAVVRPKGRLDMVAAPMLREVVRETVADGHIRVVVDLSDTTFLDSSGLGALIAGLRSAREAGGDLRIACAGEQVLMVLELTKMDTVLRPYPSAEAARDAS